MSCRRVKERLSRSGSAARVATIRSLAGAWITGSSASVPIGAFLYERRSRLPVAAAYPMIAMNRVIPGCEPRAARAYEGGDDTACDDCERGPELRPVGLAGGDPQD